MSAGAPEGVLWDALRGALVTRALALAADLRLAHALCGGPRSVEELARDASADADTLDRILRALASDGIFAETAPGVFENTAVSALLRTDGWDDFAHLFGGVWLQALAGLDASGAPSFPRLHGTGFWEWLAAHPEERAAFDRAMEQGWQGRLERLDSVDWRGDETVVDVGGGNGSLLLALLERHPRMRGIVFDLPETVRDESAFGDRCTFVGGSFFERVPSGDAFVLSTVLHDWDDASALRILRVVHTAAPDGARLVLLESTVEPGNERDGAKWLDLLMLALFAGRERSEAQWRSLLAEGASRRCESAAARSRHERHDGRDAAAAHRDRAEDAREVRRNAPRTPRPAPARRGRLRLGRARRGLASGYTDPPIRASRRPLADRLGADGCDRAAAVA